ncbi:MAG: class I SAM-dependent DNA methyltransferase [Holophaga sp.]
MMAQNLSELIWSVAELLRGDYKQSDYGKVILPFTLLRRLDCVLEGTKQAVLKEAQARKDQGETALDRLLLKAAGQSFYNTSKFDFSNLRGDPQLLKPNLLSYIRSFSPNAREIFERYKFADEVESLDSKNLLFLVTEKFAAFDLHPQEVDNTEMGLIFEELIRRFSELSNETAGEHFTPREVIRLMVNLLFLEDSEALTKPGIVRTIYDPAAGTGGMLSVAEAHLKGMNPQAKLVMFGQELNDESYAICKADMLIKGQDVANIIAGNTLSEDGHPEKKFDYMLSNPPFGVDWKKVQKVVEDEAKFKGFNGRFGPGTPRISDGALLFLLHLLSKMRPVSEGGSRVGIVLNGSPLFSGGAGSGESEIRRWVLENDMVEAIVALPTDMFYNTGISTYVWILTNHKRKERKGKVQLVNGTGLWQKMKKSLGSKRKELSEEHIAEITRIYGGFQAGPLCKIFDNEEFGYTTITVERPARDQKGRVEKDRKGEPKPDSSLRDTENVPLKENIRAYFEREVLPHAPDAWIDEKKSKVGYEIPFTRHFYEYKPPRPLAEIDADLKAKVAHIMGRLQEITE